MDNNRQRQSNRDWSVVVFCCQTPKYISKSFLSIVGLFGSLSVSVLTFYLQFFVKKKIECTCIFCFLWFNPDRPIIGWRYSHTAAYLHKVEPLSTFISQISGIMVLKLLKPRRSLSPVTPVANHCQHTLKMHVCGEDSILVWLSWFKVVSHVLMTIAVFMVIISSMVHHVERKKGTSRTLAHTQCPVWIMDPSSPLQSCLFFCSALIPNSYCRSLTGSLFPSNSLFCIPSRAAGLTGRRCRLMRLDAWASITWGQPS